jgi:hypothetical protein
MLDYEIYVLRSSYLHVMRIVGALAGRQSALVCAAIMLHFLALEDGLSKADVSLPDGTSEWLQSRKSRLVRSMSIKQREEELQEIYLIAAGPFVHDVVPILYDLFSDLTMRAPLPGTEGSAMVRGFSSEVHHVAAQSLWTAMKSLAPQTWVSLIEIDERQFRHRVQANMGLRNGLDVIDACTLMHVNACLQTCRTQSALAIWRRETRAETHPSGKAEKILEMIVRRLRYDRRRLMHALQGDTEHGDLQATSIAYAKCLDSVAKLLGDEESAVERHQLIASVHFDTIARCMFRSTFLLASRSSQPNEEASEIYNSALSAFLTWMEAQMQETLPCLPSQADRQIVSVATCNTIFKTLLRIGAQIPQHKRIFVSLLRAMMSNDRFPTPDRATWTILLNNSAKLPDLRMIPATLHAAYQLNLSSRNAEQETIDSSEVPEEIHPTNMTDVAIYDELLKEAVANNDERRLLALLDLARRSHSLNLAYSQSGRPALGAPIAAGKVVFALYPSLDINRPSRSPVTRQHRWRFRRKMAALDSGEPVIRPTKEEILKRENGIQFKLDVMTSVLRFLVSRRMTGLTERFWRLMWRVRNRKAARQAASSANEDTVHMPVTAYTQMFRLYALEQRGADKVISLRALPSYKRSVLPPRQRLLLSRDLVRGWGRYGTGTDRRDQGMVKMRSQTARQGAMHCYGQLRALWPENDPALLNAAYRPDVHLFTMLLSVFTASGIVRGGSVRLDPKLSLHEIAFLRGVRSDMELLQIATPHITDQL